jgi:hypothetical protein
MDMQALADDAKDLIEVLANEPSSLPFLKQVQEYAENIVTLKEAVDEDVQTFTAIAVNPLPKKRPTDLNHRGHR